MKIPNYDSASASANGRNRPFSKMAAENFNKSISKTNTALGRAS